MHYLICDSNTLKTMIQIVTSIQAIHWHKKSFEWFCRAQKHTVCNSAFLQKHTFFFFFFLVWFLFFRFVLFLFLYHRFVNSGNCDQVT